MWENIHKSQIFLKVKATDSGFYGQFQSHCVSQKPFFFSEQENNIVNWKGLDPWKQSMASTGRHPNGDHGLVPMQDVTSCNYHQQTNLREGNVFAPVCDSVKRGGLSPGGSLSRGFLSRGLQGVSLSRLSLSSGSMSSGSLSSESQSRGFLSMGSPGGVSVQGVSVQGVSVQGVSVQGVSVQGVSVQGVSVQGVSVQGVSVRETPPNTVKSGRYISYWNAFLFTFCIAPQKGNYKWGGLRHRLRCHMTGPTARNWLRNHNMSPNTSRHLCLRRVTWFGVECLVTCYFTGVALYKDECAVAIAVNGYSAAVIGVRLPV